MSNGLWVFTSPYFPERSPLQEGRFPWLVVRVWSGARDARREPTSADITAETAVGRGPGPAAVPPWRCGWSWAAARPARRPRGGAGTGGPSRGPLLAGSRLAGVLIGALRGVDAGPGSPDH